MNNEQKPQSLPSASLVQNGMLAESVSVKPILFSTEMVKAILEGRKTMTRRTKGLPDLVKDKVHYHGHDYNGNFYFEFDDFNSFETRWHDAVKCPYGKIDDILWVRETCGKDKDGSVFYKADGINCMNWTPSIFMPKTACRIFLKISNIKVERLQEISFEDICLESYDIRMSRDIGSLPYFKKLWTRINGGESWEENPFVWVISFEPTDCPPGFR